MPLTQRQIEEGIGRAGLVFELLEVERRAVALTDVVDELRSKKQAAEHGGEEYAEDVAAFAAAIETREAEIERLTKRERELSELLWGEGARAGELDWRDEVRGLDRERALLAVEQLLRRRPEVTPPERIEERELGWIHDWLQEKIGELPQDERSGWVG